MIGDLMPCGDVARYLGVTTDTVRMLDREGLLTPAERTTRGIKLWRLADVERLRQQGPDVLPVPRPRYAPGQRTKAVNV